MRSARPPSSPSGALRPSVPGRDRARRACQTPGARALAAWLGVLVALAAGASAQSYRTYGYTELDGLPSAEITDLAQGPDGRMWFATAGGLATFDGVAWQVLEDELAPPVDRPRALGFGADGALWVVGREPHLGVAMRRDGEWWAVTTPPQTLDAGLSMQVEVLDDGAGPMVAVLCESGVLWLLREGTWLRLDDGGALSEFGVRGIAATDSGQLWIAAAGGAFVYTPADGTQPRPAPDLGGGGTLLGVATETLPSGSLRLWFVGPDRIAVREGDGDSRYFESERQEQRRFAPVNLCPDGRGGAYYGGLPHVYRLDRGAERAVRVGMNEGLGSLGALALFRDREQNVWIAGYRGVSRVPPPRFANYDRNQELLEDEACSLLELSDGTLAVGQPGGISLIAPDGGVKTLSFAADEDHQLALRIALDLAQDSHGVVWIAGYSAGVGCWSPGDESIVWKLQEDALRSTVSSVYVDEDDTVWVSDHRGVAFLQRDPETGELEFARSDFDLPDQAAVRRIVHDDEAGFVLASSSHGLFLENGGAWLNARHADPDFNNTYGALRTRDGVMYVATRAGLCIQRGAELVPAGAPFDRFDHPVYSLLEDRRGDLWIGTDRGVFRHVRGEGDAAGALEVFTVYDGLAGQETNRAAAIEDSNGRLWFGTHKGLSRLLEDQPPWPAPPPAPTLSLLSDGAEYENTEAVALPRGREDLTFRFQSISFARDARVEYAYRLASADGEFEEHGRTLQNEVRFARLPVGSYSFEVSASSRETANSASTTFADIRVRPPIWLSTWAFGLYALLLLASTVVFRALVSARRRSARLSDLVDERSRALDESERRYREIFERNRSAQLIVDPRTRRVLDANPAARATFGPDERGVRGASLATLLGLPEDELAEKLGRIERGDSVQLVLDRHDPRAPERNLELYACTFELGGREVVQATVLDVTNRVRLEEELRQAEKLKSLGQLAGGIAHDFNNLLTAILGTAEQARGELPEDHATRRDLDDIRRAGQRGAKLIAQLLAFSRQQVLHAEVLEINAIVHESVCLLGRLLEEPIHITTDFDPDAGYVRIDRGQLDRVLFNLALNARDAMPGGGELRISTSREERGRNGGTRPGVLLRVRDDGAGMDADVLARVFDPFFTTKEVGKGTGLGMATVHGIVHQSGGEIGVSSSPGEGTCVDIWLPAVDAAEFDADPPLELFPRPAAPPPPPARATGSKTVLFVEDDDDIRRLGTRALERVGIEVLEASNGEEALALCGDAPERIDLLLTDVVMPRLGGRDLATRLRQRHAGLRVIYISGYDEERDSAHVTTIPDTYLQKPFSIRELRARVLELLADS